MEWLRIEEFLAEIEFMKPHAIWKIHKATLMLHEEYKSPEQWLSTPNDKRKRFIYNKSYSESWYILIWAWKNQLFSHPIFRNTLFDYFVSLDSKTLFKIWPKRLELITEQEWDEIYTFSPARRKSLAKGVSLQTLFLMKPLNNFSDQDYGRFLPVYDFNKMSVKYNKSLLNDLLIKLGYTNKIVNKNGRSNNWEEKLIPHPIWGNVMLEYRNYLLSAQAREKYIKNVSSILVALLDYLDKQGIPDCSTFTENDFYLFTKHLLESREPSSVNVMIAKYKKFFIWGSNYNNLFPKVLSFPEKYWKSIARLGQENREKSDGFAFKKDGMADLIVEVLKTANPDNEIELLCKLFWQIIASCPARQNFVLNLEATEVLQPLPNQPEAYGIYSKDADKAGNRFGQFPILDEMGINAIKSLQERAILKKLPPLLNAKNKRNYVHLFQLTEPPWLLSRQHIYQFLQNKIRPKLANFDGINLEEISGGTHAFRHYILTEIVRRTGSEEVAFVAAGHRDGKMIRKAYLKSKHSRKALLFRAIDKFENGEITGKFYLRLIELLTDDNPSGEMKKDLTKEMSLAEFISKHGRRTEMGYCFDEDHTCKHYLKCWNCPSFLLKREEIEGAITLLRKLTFEMEEIFTNSVDFSFENTIAQNKMTAISLITERLKDLGIDEEKIESMVLQGDEEVGGKT